MDGSRNPEANGMPRKLPPLDDEDPLDSSGAPAHKKKPRGRRPSVDGFGRSSGGGGGGGGDGGSDGRADAADGGESSGGIDRERLLNDILNTGVMGALIGGFALSQIQMKFDNSQPFDVPIYLCSFLGVHACTCSCVTSAVLYRSANKLSDEETPLWAERNKMLLMMPIVKFGMGCVSYLASVVLLSFRDLEDVPAYRYLALAVGATSMSMTIIIATIMQLQDSKASSRSEKFSRIAAVPRIEREELLDNSNSTHTLTPGAPVVSSEPMSDADEGKVELHGGEEEQNTLTIPGSPVPP